MATGGKPTDDKGKPMHGDEPAYEKIHAGTALGPVHYNVAHLHRMVSFYSDIIGMKVLRRDADFAALGTDERELLHMTKVSDPPGGPAGPGSRTTGLYHTAFLVPTKRDLAYLTRTLIDTRTPVQGTSDHGTHLALYLPDPEGNGIELAWDHPREQWPDLDGQPDLSAAPRRGVDIEDLLQTIEGDDEGWKGIGSGSTVGHIHLHVVDLDESRRFYNEVLGFDVILHSPSMGASFLSAGGYHHHVGMNIWKGRGLPPAEPGALGLRYFTVVVPDEEELQRVLERVRDGATSKDSGNGEAVVTKDADGIIVVDPSGIDILFTVSD